MKKYFALFLLVFFFACGMPMAQRVDLVPNEPAPAYENMILVLQELGYTIKHTDKASFIILAEKLTTGEAFSAALSGQAMPFQVSISMAAKEGQTSYWSILFYDPDQLTRNRMDLSKLTYKISY